MHFKIYLAGAMSGLDFDEYYTWRKCVKQQLKQKNTCSDYSNAMDSHHF